MKSWKRMLAAVLGSTMILSQGMSAFAEETEPEAEFGAEPGAGENIIVSEKSVPQPETTVPAPQPETTAPAPQNELYVRNADSSWTVTTDYYTMTIPPAWTYHFDASVRKQYNTGYNLQVVSKENADAGFGGHLFTIMLIPQSEDYTVFPSYDYLGTMNTPEGNLNVIILYPTDVQSGDVWTEFYKILNGDKNTAISSMRPKAGIVWTLPDGKTISGDSTQAMLDMFSAI